MEKFNDPDGIFFYIGRVSLALVEAVASIS